VGYVQGMNVLLAPLLYVMPTELDAFACFTALLAKHCPRYILANLEGVHAGCSLAEACLCALDPALHRHLQHTVQLHMEIFMFQYVLTLFANMSQLDQVLLVWDALFAFGVHFNCVLGR
jgi:cell cycle arrest protein BUB2